jgi:GntR family transcriptional repressor for pyruvate dehydrogenase complex
MSAVRRAQVRQPRLAEMIAAQLRDRILAGEFGDGAMLPKQDDLLDEFGVSPPSLREALRILETEGLVTVQRGNIGGAVVHQPQVDKVAYMLALVMQGRAVTLGDVSLALSRLDPACAAECAGRKDRRRAVVPRLRAVLSESRQALDQPRVYMASAREFHEEVVRLCGNETMILVVGTLESLWAAHVQELLSQERELSGGFEDRANRSASLADHEALVDLIAAGDQQGAETLAREHLAERPPASYPFRLDRPVVAGLVRGDYGNVGGPLR